MLHQWSGSICPSPARVFHWAYYDHFKDNLEQLAGDFSVLINRYDPYGAQQYAEVLKSFTSYLKEWLSSVATEGDEVSESAKALMLQLDDMTTAPEIIAENPAVTQKGADRQEALYEINGRYLHIQEAADGSWHYTCYNPFMEELVGGQVCDATMEFQQAGAEILDFLNLSNVPLTGVLLSKLQELTKKCENDLHCPVYHRDLIQARADGEIEQ